MDSLRREMDGLFDRFFRLRNGNGISDWSYEPQVNVAEHENGYEITAELPGMKPEDFSVEVKDDELWITGEKKEEHEEKDRTYHRVERRYGEFRRVIPLATKVDSEHIDAQYKDGVLTVKLPKSETAKPKRITVNS
jgi:HSP20 family protein